MKTKRFYKKLVLNKKTIADLSGSIMGNVNGGIGEKTAIVTNCALCQPTQTCSPTCGVTCGVTCGLTCTCNATECETVSPCIC
jgi:hypothetical protein